MFNDFESKSNLKLKLYSCNYIVLLPNTAILLTVRKIK